MSSDQAVATTNKKRKRAPKKKVIEDDVEEQVVVTQEQAPAPPEPQPVAASASVPAEVVASPETSAPSSNNKPKKRLSAKNRTKKLQKSTELVLAKLPLKRYIRYRLNEINKESSGIGKVAMAAGNNTVPVRFEADAVTLIHESLESFLNETLTQGKRVMENRNHLTLTIQDLRVAKRNLNDIVSKQIVSELDRVNPIIIKRKTSKSTRRKNPKKLKVTAPTSVSETPVVVAH